VDSDQSASPRAPLWLGRPWLFERSALILIVTATVAGVAAETLVAPSVGGVVGPLLAVAGVMVGLRHPLPGVLLLGAAPVATALLQHEPLLTWTITVFASFLLTFRGFTGYLTTAVVGLANTASVLFFEHPEKGWLNPVALVALSLTAVAAATGSAARVQLRFFQTVQQSARDAIATRDIEANRRVAEERLRIARDLHDVVGHEVAVLGMHLGVAEVSTPAANETARAALSSARVALQSILRETQHILDVLRPSSQGESRQPAPAVADIAALVESVRSAGMRVEAVLPADLAAVSGAAGVTAYRIAQEALTNAQRHGDGTARVDLLLNRRELRLEVSNPIRGGQDQSPGRGYGLIGIRERAASMGGRVEIGSVGDVFRVVAVLPTEERGDS
jgi:signal transduction histidine kinase